MLVRLKLYVVRISAWWTTRKGLVVRNQIAEDANILLRDRLTLAYSGSEQATHLLEHADTELKEAKQEIEMLQGKIDVITNQIELSATIISSYQAIEETRIAIATADRVRALAEPTEERMQ